MSYADYEYYSTKYLGNALTKAEFPRLALRASSFLDYYTMGKAAKAADLDAVKMACCAIAEQYKLVDTAQLAANKAMDNADAAGLKSQTVGGWSQTYQSGAESAKEALSAYEYAKEQLIKIAQQYLVGTGLLYRGRCF